MPLKVTYESSEGVTPPKLNQNPDDDMVRNAYVTTNSRGICGYTTIEDSWADLMSHHTVEVNDDGRPAITVNEETGEL